MPEQYKNRKRDNLPLWQKIISDMRFLATLAVFGMGGTVYGNVPAVRNALAAGIAEVDGQTEVLINGQTFEELMVRHTHESNARMDDIQGQVEVLKAELSLTDQRNVKRLMSEINDLKSWKQRAEALGE